MLKKKIKKIIRLFQSPANIVSLEEKSQVGTSEIESSLAQQQAFPLPSSHLKQHEQSTTLPEDVNKSEETLLKEINKEMQALKRELLQHQISTKWSLHDELVKQQTNKQLAPQYCPFCNQDLREKSLQTFESHCIFEGGDLLRYQCPECDIIFGPTKILNLSPEALSREYFWHYQTYSEGDSTELELRAFYAMNPKRDGIYLNWGAGRWSNTLKVLKEEGWNVFGYDPFSPSATHTDLYIQDKNHLSSQRFDGIFSNNVLEHLQDPIGDLLTMKAILKDDGVMVHATPCFEYMYEYTRFHLFFFLGRSRELLASRAMMKLEKYYQDGIFMYIMLTKQY